MHTVYVQYMAGNSGWELDLTDGQCASVTPKFKSLGTYITRVFTLSCTLGAPPTFDAFISDTCGS